MKFTMIALYSQLNALHLKISQKYAHNRYTTQICKYYQLTPLKMYFFECCTTTKYLFELLDNVNNFKIVLSIN